MSVMEMGVRRIEWQEIGRGDGLPPWRRATLDEAGITASVAVFPAAHMVTGEWSLHTGVMIDGRRVDTVRYFSEAPTDAQVRAEVAVVVALDAYAVALRQAGGAL